MYNVGLFNILLGCSNLYKTVIFSKIKYKFLASYLFKIVRKVLFPADTTRKSSDCDARPSRFSSLLGLLGLRALKNESSFLSRRP